MVKFRHGTSQKFREIRITFLQDFFMSNLTYSYLQAHKNVAYVCCAVLRSQSGKEP
jgi:hypothetical protein